MENKVRLQDRMLDVVEYETYMSNPQLYDAPYTAIKGNEYVYPIRSKTDTRPGMYQAGVFAKFVDPTDEEDKQAYSVNNIIDFQNISSLSQYIEKANEFRDEERIILTTPDNIYVPDIRSNDSPVMKGLKQAVIMKEIDINKYEQRFGKNFNNDKRLFNNPTISLSKLETIAKALDMKLTLTIEDSDANVANPMKDKVVVELIVGDDTDETE